MRLFYILAFTIWYWAGNSAAKIDTHARKGLDVAKELIVLAAPARRR